ncbi:MAG: adenine/guanine/hypoxanthine permease [Solirubrobacteraceae bacterium]|nr:adenine/guanine/hypoxanthine permease [Solirubrobacteraceae bacterium]
MSATAASASPSPAQGAGFLERRFRLSERGTSARVELLGGVATFLTMSYILFVNPAILSAAGMPFRAVAVATAIAAAVTTLAMGLFTNLPFALAPGLGINAVVAFDIVLGRKVHWPVAMSIVVIEGLIALVLVLAGLRTAIMRAVPLSLKLAIGVGIGLFITLVGLREGGIVINNPATGIGLGELTGGAPLVALAGILVAAVLVARGVRGAVVLGVLAATVLGLIFGVLKGPSGVVDVPGSGDFSTIGDALDPSNLGDALTLALIPVIFSLFMSDFFDTIGTAVAVGRGAGLVDEQGEMEGVGRLLLVDSAAASVGGAMGCSSVTTYVESGAGVAEGARTGLSSVVVAALFALAILFVPVISLVGQDVKLGETLIHPAIAPALVMVGYLMIRIVADIDWSLPENSVPAFLTIAGIPMTFSIAAGIGLGVIGYVVTMVATGKARAIHPLMWVIAPFFVAFFAANWLSKNVF